MKIDQPYPLMFSKRNYSNVIGVCLKVNFRIKKKYTKNISNFYDSINY